MLYSLLRPFLFLFDSEFVHHLGLKNLRRFSPLFKQKMVKDPITLLGINFPNRVGLAAGLDKDADCFEALSDLGFGFVEVGTVTPLAQPGNDKPRLFRLEKHQAIINRFGFNNKGVDHLVAQVEKSKFKGVIGINIGKNKTTPNEKAIDDYLICLEKVYPYADYVTINISSPNTPDLRQLQFGEPLKNLLNTLKQKQQQLLKEYERQVPLFVKIAPDIDEEALEELAEIIKQTKIDGVIATNTTVSRDAVTGAKSAMESGGLSGAPLTQISTEVIRRLREELGEEIPIIGVGGIMSAKDAVDKIKAGANLVQIYTGFIYKGPSLITEAALAVKNYQSNLDES